MSIMRCTRLVEPSSRLYLRAQDKQQQQPQVWDRQAMPHRTEGIHTSARHTAHSMQPPATVKTQPPSPSLVAPHKQVILEDIQLTVELQGTGERGCR